MQRILEGEIKGGMYIFYDGDYDSKKMGYYGELVFDYSPEEKVWTRNEYCCMTNLSLDGSYSRYTIFTIYTGNEKFEKIIYVYNERKWYFLTGN